MGLVVVGLVAVDDEVVVHLPVEGAHGGVVGLHEGYEGVGVVPKAPVGQAVAGPSGQLRLHVQPFHAHVHGHEGGYVQGPLMGHGGVQIEELRGALVHVHDDGHVLLDDHVLDARADLLREDAVLVAGIEPVHVADLRRLRAHQLPAGGALIVVPVGPLIHRVGEPVAHPEGAGGAVLQGDGEQILHAVQGGGVGEAGGVGPGHDEDPALGHLDVLRHGDGRHHAGALVGMGAAQHQEGAAGHAGIEHVDLLVPYGALQVGAVLREPGHPGEALAGHHGLRGPHGEEVVGRHGGEQDRHQQHQDIFPKIAVFLHGRLLT